MCVQSLLSWVFPLQCFDEDPFSWPQFTSDWQPLTGPAAAVVGLTIWSVQKGSNTGVSLHWSLWSTLQFGAWVNVAEVHECLLDASVGHTRRNVEEELHWNDCWLTTLQLPPARSDSWPTGCDSWTELTGRLDEEIVFTDDAFERKHLSRNVSVTFSHPATIRVVRWDALTLTTQTSRTSN